MREHHFGRWNGHGGIIASVGFRNNRPAPPDKPGLFSPGGSK